MSRTRKLLTPHEKLNNRKVKVLDPSAFAKDQAHFLPPKVVVEDKGYYRRLNHDEIGRDKRGNVIHGRTWVEHRSSYTKPDRWSALSLRRTRKPLSTTSPDAGSIYIMRCASHGKDIFKVGLTRRDVDDRAEELTASTSSPSEFLPVCHWSVTNCVLAEKEIHEALAAFRVSGRREFFQAPLQTLNMAITPIIEKYMG